MKKTIIKFDDIDIERKKIHQGKRLISIKNIDFDKIVVSNKASFGKNAFKYFIGYKDAKTVTISCIFVPEMSAYKRDVNETKYISFIIKYHN